MQQETLRNRLTSYFTPMVVKRASPPGSPESGQGKRSSAFAPPAPTPAAAMCASLRPVLRPLFFSLLIIAFTLKQTLALLTTYRPNEPLLPYLIVLIAAFFALGLHAFEYGLTHASRWHLAGGVTIILVLHLVIMYIFPGPSLATMLSLSSPKFVAQRDVGIVILTTNRPASTCRREAIGFYLNRVELPFAFVLGVDGSKYNSTRAMALSINQTDVDVDKFESALTESQKRFRGMVVHSLSMRQALVKADRSKPWVLSFEDDAKPLPGFVLELEHALTKYEAYDQVWLDIRNALAWAALGQVVGGMAGTVYKTSTLDRVLQVMRLDSVHFMKWVRDGRIPEYDAFAAEMCNQGVFKCAVLPIVAEAGFVTMNKDVAANLHFKGRQD